MATLSHNISVGGTTAGAVVSVTWAGIAVPHANDYVGLFLTSGGAYKAYKFTAGAAAATVPFVIPATLPAGNYVFLLKVGGTNVIIGTSTTFAVAAAVALPVTLTTDRAAYAGGDTIVFTWANRVAPLGSDNVIVVSANTQQDSTSIGTAVNGTGQFLIAGFYPVGTYDLRMRRANGDVIKISQSFTVGAPASLVTVTPTAVTIGGSVTVAWSGMPFAAVDDFVSLHNPSDSDSDQIRRVWEATGTNTASGSLSLPIALVNPDDPPIQPGIYEARYYSIDVSTPGSYRRIATSVTPVQIVGVGGQTLGLSQSTAQVDGAVTVTWANIAAPTPLDYISMHPIGTPDNNRQIYAYTDGESSGSMVFPISGVNSVSGTVALGAYELRYYSNNTFTRLATSGTLTIVAGPSVTVDPPKVVQGTSSTIRFNNIAGPIATDRVGLYLASGGAAVSFAIYNPLAAATGSTELLFATASLATDTYVLKLHRAGDLTVIATSNQFDVLASNGSWSYINPLDMLIHTLTKKLNSGQKLSATQITSINKQIRDAKETKLAIAAQAIGGVVTARSAAEATYESEQDFGLASSQKVIANTEMSRAEQLTFMALMREMLIAFLKDAGVPYSGSGMVPYTTISQHAAAFLIYAVTIPNPGTPAAVTGLKAAAKMTGDMLSSARQTRHDQIVDAVFALIAAANASPAP